MQILLSCCSVLRAIKYFLWALHITLQIHKKLTIISVPKAYLALSLCHYFPFTENWVFNYTSQSYIMSIYLQRNLVFFSVYVKSIASVPLWGSGRQRLQVFSLRRCLHLMKTMSALLSTLWTKTFNEMGQSCWPGSGVYRAKTSSQKIKSRHFPGGAVVKNPPANAGDMGSSSVWEDPTCLKATKPMCHSYWACALEPVCHNYWSPRA